MRAAKVTTFYKIAAFSTLFGPIFGPCKSGFQHRRDGHFFARDGHYDSNDHREHFKGRFRAVRKLPFSPPPPPRRAYRQNTEGRNAIVRRPNAPNVYLYIIRKIFTIPSGELSAPCQRPSIALYTLGPNQDTATGHCPPEERYPGSHLDTQGALPPYLPIAPSVAASLPLGATGDAAQIKTNKLFCISLGLH